MDSLMKYISRIHRCSGRYRGEKIEGLNGRQHTYIFHVCKRPGISQDQLARHICVNKSNITRQLSALEQSGFVRREPDPDDRRVLRVYPTDKAERALPRVCELMEEWNRLLLEDLKEDERTVLLSLLDRVTQKAMAAVEETDTDPAAESGIPGKADRS